MDWRIDEMEGKKVKNKFKCPHGYKYCKWKCNEKCLKTDKKDFCLVRALNRLKEMIGGLIE